MSDTEFRKQPLFTVYVDFQKVFDSVSIACITAGDTKFVKNLAASCRISEVINGHADNDINPEIIDIDIKQGLFQVDALRPLCFCLALRLVAATLKQQRRE